MKKINVSSHRRRIGRFILSVLAFVLIFTRFSIHNVISASVPKVEFRQVGEDDWVMLRDGKPYNIRGAGGYDRFEELAAAGGNSIRVWDAGPYTGTILRRVDSLGLTVMVGISERELAKIDTIVPSYRNSPALLIWAIGNEMELRLKELGYSNEQALWTRVNELAQRIHALDEHHPVITVLAEINREKIKRIMKYAPELDAIGVNSYGLVGTVAKRLRAWGWNKPFIITEFGSIGHWESPRTPWGLYIEPSSTEKAKNFIRGYTEGIMDQPGCVGSYAFLWGHKQEKTHTWCGMFLPNEVGGGPTETVDAMIKVWTGSYPANRAPQIGPGRIRIEPDQYGEKYAFFAPDEEIEVSVDASDPEGGALKVRWDLRIDVADNPTGGGFYEPTPPPIIGAIREAKGLTAKVKFPKKPGNYRLFCYVWDSERRAATVNLPIRVE